MKSICIVLLCAFAAGGYAAPCETMTVDFASGTAPRKQVYQASAKCYTITLKNNGSTWSGTGYTPIFYWATSNSATAVSTATVAWVTQTTGVFTATFDASDLNYAAGNYIYGVGAVSGETAIARQGDFTIIDDPYTTGAGPVDWTTNINWSLYSYQNTTDEGPYRFTGATYTTNVDGSVTIAGFEAAGSATVVSNALAAGASAGLTYTGTVQSVTYNGTNHLQTNGIVDLGTITSAGTETDPVAQTQIWAVAQYPSAALTDGTRDFTAGVTITNLVNDDTLSALGVRAYDGRIVGYFSFDGVGHAWNFTNCIYYGGWSAFPDLDAPSNTLAYARKATNWVAVSEVGHDHALASVTNAGDLAAEDWPASDDKEYVAKNGAWYEPATETLTGDILAALGALTNAAAFDTNGAAAAAILVHDTNATAHTGIFDTNNAATAAVGVHTGDTTDAHAASAISATGTYSTVQDAINNMGAGTGGGSYLLWTNNVDADFYQLDNLAGLTIVAQPGDECLSNGTFDDDTLWTSNHAEITWAAGAWTWTSNATGESISQATNDMATLVAVDSNYRFTIDVSDFGTNLPGACAVDFMCGSDVLKTVYVSGTGTATLTQRSDETDSTDGPLNIRVRFIESMGATPTYLTLSSASIVAVSGGDVQLSGRVYDEDYNITLDPSYRQLFDSDGFEALNWTTASALVLAGIWTFPAADGNSNDVLQTDGAGGLSFVAPVTDSGSITSHGSQTALGITAGGHTGTVSRLWGAGSGGAAAEIVVSGGTLTMGTDSGTLTIPAGDGGATNLVDGSVLGYDSSTKTLTNATYRMSHSDVVVESGSGTFTLTQALHAISLTGNGTIAISTGTATFDFIGVGINAGTHTLSWGPVVWNTAYSADTAGWTNAILMKPYGGTITYGRQ